jgi:DNA (cytosine-5)-methyltransferase 1
MYVPTANGYFSGAGLLEIGVMQAGVNILQSLDLDREATAAMERNKHYFSHPVLTEDIKQKTVLEQPASDIALFTYPCNKYSAIADIHGTRTGDDLFLHAFRHIVLTGVEMYVVENVPGMRKFKVVMEAMTKIPGYHTQVFCPVDAENWLPQRRRRLILFGTRKPFNFSAPAQISNRPKIKDLLESNPEVELTDSVISRINGEYRDKPIVVDPECPNAIAPTCVAHYAKDKGTRLVKDCNSKYGVRPFTVREYARLQGVPDDFHFENKVSSYRLIGNGVPVPMGRWIGQQAMKYFN